MITPIREDNHIANYSVSSESNVRITKELLPRICGRWTATVHAVLYYPHSVGNSELILSEATNTLLDDPTASTGESTGKKNNFNRCNCALRSMPQNYILRYIVRQALQFKYLRGNSA
eukprot:g71979.t1